MLAERNIFHRNMTPLIRFVGSSRNDVCHLHEITKCKQPSMCNYLFLLVQVWLVYLLNGEKLPGKVLAVILVAAYMVAKGKFLLRSAKAMKLAAEKMWQATVRKGAKKGSPNYQIG